MKLLKKIILNIFIGLLFFSCTNDDDSNKKEDELIIGTWKLISNIENGEELLAPSDCDLLFIFTTDRVTTQYYEDENCTTQLNDTWSYFIYDDTITINESHDFADLVILELNSSTLKIKEIDDINTSISTYKKQ